MFSGRQNASPRDSIIVMHRTPDCFHLLVNVLHHFELSTGCVDLGNGSWGKLVDELAENSSIANNIFIEFTRWELGAKYGFDPFLGFSVLFGVSLSGDLSK